MISRLVATLLFIFFVTVPLAAQCSDAGACVIAPKQRIPQHQIGVMYTFGTSGKPEDLTFHAVRLQGEFPLFTNSRVSIEIPYSSQRGSLGTVSGIADPIIVWNQTLSYGTSSSLLAHIGLKIAVGDVNAGNLPQAYQSSLGTNDLLLGLTYDAEPWSVSAVYQLSRGRSENRIDRLQRGDDLLVRTGYRFSIDPIRLSAELLAIKRLHESSVRHRASANPDQYITLPNSDQFQINIQGRAILPLSQDNALSVQIATPLLQRDVNVDGLKRSLSLSVGITHTL